MEFATLNLFQSASCRQPISGGRTGISGGGIDVYGQTEFRTTPGFQEADVSRWALNIARPNSGPVFTSSTLVFRQQSLHSSTHEYDDEWNGADQPAEKKKKLRKYDYFVY